MFFRKLFVMKNDKVNFDIIFKKNEEYISITNGCIQFILSYQFLLIGLDEFFKKLDNDDFNSLKKEFPDKWQKLH